MQSKRHDLLLSLCLVALLSSLLLVLLFLSRQSVEVRVYDAHTGALLFHANVENLTPARQQRTSVGWLFLDVKQRLYVRASAAGYHSSAASWQGSRLGSGRGRLDVHLFPTRLIGLVRDAETGLPLPGAKVWIGADQLVADVFGVFHRSALSGEELVRVYLEGYEPWQGEVLWERHLLEGPRMIVDLEPNLVEGQIRWQETGELLPGARVTAPEQEVITDQGGRFSLRRLRIGDTITAQKEGFWPAKVTYDGHPIDISLSPDCVEGRVRWQETGELLPEVTVETAGQRTSTDQTGRFRLPGVRAGDVIRVEQAGFWPEEVAYTGQSLDLDISLQDRQAWVTVRSALQGMTLSDLQVTRDGQSIVASSPGVFELRALKVGEVLDTTASGHWPSQIRLGAPEGQSFRELEKIELVLQPRVLTVTVRDGYTGWPLTGALVGSSPSRPANNRGQVIMVPAMPGMAITVEYPDYISQTLQYDGRSSELEVRLVPHTVRGVVLDAETRGPVSGAAFRRNGQTLLRTTQDGSFRLENVVEQPAFEVRVPGYRPAQVMIGNLASPNVPFSCSEGDAASGLCWEIRIIPFEARGVYIPFGLLTSRQRTLAILDMISSTELNAVVVDVKGDRGWLAYTSDLPLAKELRVSAQDIMDISEFLDICRQRGIYTVARLVVFKDNPLAHGRIDLAVKQADGSVWLDREGLGWANPYREEVWDYNIGIAKEVALLGFDEVQLDYVRFPSDGDLAQIVYEEKDTPQAKVTASRTFVVRMREALEPYDVFLSADVFGLTLVADPQSDLGIGQRVIDIAPYVDYLCPMVYPSTFIPGNMGMANPVLHPYEVVAKSLRQGMALTLTRIRPWLQAYSLHGVEYDLTRQDAQRRAAEMLDTDGWTFWNAGGRYDARLFRRHEDDDGCFLSSGRTCAQ
ncbi:MAG: hypothetical protein JSV36_05685 [Anaerolineae bacterium]|nr:MAG: hypothetical protein JSV36_05685 [Anaerolineae bacterium]